MPFYLRPSAPTAADGLICGDPARALAIAQHVMVQPRMSNHNRGLWGYYGETRDGRPLTVQATGIGGPSAVAVLGESIELGMRRAIRIGTCAASGGEPVLGSALVVDHAIGDDGASRALNGSAGERIPTDVDLTARLAATCQVPTGSVRSVDVIATASGSIEPAGSPVVVDLQTAAVVSLCHIHGVEIAAGLVVGSSGGRRLEDEPLEAALLRMAMAAASVFAQPQSRVEG